MDSGICGNGWKKVYLNDHMSGTQDAIWGNCFVFELVYANLMLCNDMGYNITNDTVRHPHVLLLDCVTGPSL